MKLSSDRYLREFLEFAHELAEISGALIRDAFRRPHSVAVKDDASPVTPADKAVESRLREQISARYPQHGILGEEYDDIQANAELVWVIDPIDGTKQFAAGLPTFATLIALAHDGRPVVGIIDQPVTSERWVGMSGAGTTFNGKPVRTRRCEHLANAILATSAPDYFDAHAAPAYQRLHETTRWSLYGAGCHAYGQMATGCIDIGLEAEHSAYDFCALAPIVDGAGGAITDWQGDALTIHSGDRFIAAGDPRIHRQALALIESTWHPNLGARHDEL
ncbi:MAG: histidinol-phosphatase [Gammaproteobacteria bacterium]|nr:histidinol-phosphatase [Gammaproteobacteria bacterium]MDH3465132.1 histidinol-phosphatase [Gammaproteobacteria bacterium]